MNGCSCSNKSVGSVCFIGFLFVVIVIGFSFVVIVIGLGIHKIRLLAPSELLLLSFF
jgi:hypothetical protein